MVQTSVSAITYRASSVWVRVEVKYGVEWGGSEVVDVLICKKKFRFGVKNFCLEKKFSPWCLGL